jgi:hypothetical protein
VKADVIIDFSNAKAVDDLLVYSVDKKIPVVLCTTGLSEEQMIAPIDKTRGRMLLDDILHGGNFGHHDKRHAWGHDAYKDNGFKHGALGHNLLRLYRDARLLRYYPAEALSEPLFRIWHLFWRMRNKKC